MASLIGIQLRAAREQRGLSLLDAAHATRISPRLLTWLEQDDYAAFGSLTYARSFLKNYSAYLAVDAGELLKELPSGRLHGPRDYRYLTAHLGPWVPLDPGLTRHLAEMAQKKADRSPVPAAIALFVLLAIGTGIWGHRVSQRTAMAGIEDGPPALTSAPGAVEPDILSVQAAGRPALHEALEETKHPRHVSHPQTEFEAGIPETLQ